MSRSDALDAPPAPRQGPILIEEGDPALAAPAPSPAEAPSPDAAEAGAAGPGAGGEGAGARAARFAARRGGWLGRMFWAGAGGFAALALGAWAWELAGRLMQLHPALGWAADALLALAALALAGIAARELAALARLRRVERLRATAAEALARRELSAARAAAAGLERLYAGRADLDWARARMAERQHDELDAEGLLALAEREYMARLDAEARAAVEAAARQVAAATALAPAPLIDVLAALALNLRMIRRVAFIYGGRAGAVGSWRLLRAVAGHLIATGAVAVGDDLLGPVLGGGALARLSRRFGEGLVNGALTARVGAAAIEVCRPLPFAALPPPRARALVARALRGFAGGG
ncbi:YcjF family protein [Oceanicella actignis]|uniref:Putative membrane protein n=1 Tax=Oceanicella actignis TaxID=1189325 RepID=A0A1M7SV33_9RHOB|nr:YcjF family protein [Oceanicella actignis]SES72037.1 putative membrane protein [Oceanicella actignis]SHN62311.1 putative membrane protein [Oceanicella actignis]